MIELRDDFAKTALAGLLVMEAPGVEPMVSAIHNPETVSYLAARSYQIADAMLKARAIHDPLGRDEHGPSAKFREWKARRAAA